MSIAIKKIPTGCGVYFLKNKKEEIFYIGKANNLRSRIRSHLRKSHVFFANLSDEIADIAWKETQNEIEALLLEPRYIKRYQPRYNIMARDDKQYFYVGITNEDLPWIFITHQPCRGARHPYIGPFTDGKALKRVFRYLRKIFPYYTKKRHGVLPCPYCHLGQCPGVNPDTKEYQKTIRALKDVLTGKRKSVAKRLQKQMRKHAKKMQYEKAAELRDLLKALENIFSHRFYLREEEKYVGDRISYKGIADMGDQIESIEGYDISNIQGKESTASMVRFDNGKPNKALYRKFKIRLLNPPAGGPNDTAMIREVITRRLAHSEWPYPDLILIDGGKPQLNAALRSLDELRVAVDAEGQEATRVTRRGGIPQAEASAATRSGTLKIAALAKRENELFIPGRKKPIKLNKDVSAETRNLLMYMRDEAHRFAKSYHTHLRRKKFSLALDKKY